MLFKYNTGVNDMMVIWSEDIKHLVITEQSKMLGEVGTALCRGPLWVGKEDDTRHDICKNCCKRAKMFARMDSLEIEGYFRRKLRDVPGYSARELQPNDQYK